MSPPPVIAGRYELDRRIGVGGMATVHLAFDRRLERHVAVKLLAEHLADDPSFVSRFRREALAAARLVHPNIVQVFDFGFDERTAHHFIVMEHIRGRSGAELLRDRQRLAVAEAVDMAVQACHGLDYAHRNGVVHRDVKPGNLLRSDEGVVKLADFGIAKAAEQTSITQVGSVLGTAAYLAPEQARGEPAGPEADIYSLAVVAYQLTSGRLPYEASSLSELALRQQNEKPPALDELEPSAPPAVAHAIARGLALEPSARPPDALAFGALLEAGLRGDEPAGATEATRALPGTGPTRLLGPQPATTATRVASRPRPAEPATARGRAAAAPAPVRAERPRPAANGAPAARRRGLRRALLGVVLILLLCAGGAAAVIATSNTPQAVKDRQVVGRSFDQVYDSMRGLIDDNTK